jgi:sugar lactone lactonase YvrE
VTDAGMVAIDDERVTINDGIAIRGGLVFGTKHVDCREKIAALYQYDCGFRKLHVLAGEQICSNGKYYRTGQGADTLIDIDTLPKTISRYQIDHADGQIHSRSLVIPPDSLPALPDGLRPTPDGEGIVVAFYNPAPVADGVAQEIRLSDGAVVAEWRVPGSPRVTCPEFVRVGSEIRIIFTTAVEGMTEEVRRIAPEAGTLFWAPTPYTALPDPPPLLAACAFR